MSSEPPTCECSRGLAGGFRVHDCDCPVHGPMPTAECDAPIGTFDDISPHATPDPVVLCPCWSPAGRRCELPAGHDGPHAHDAGYGNATMTAWTTCYPEPKSDG